MLVAAIATGVIAASDHHTPITFVISALKALPLSHATQDWMFLCFAAAFLVKMPLVPFHGWLPDGYKTMPIPAVAVFSAILSKVAAYGFLRIVLPLFPYASAHYQTLMLVIALVSVLWATRRGDDHPDARMVIAYSSVAQMGFIMLGIFSLQSQGVQGALLQMVNHALVSAPLFFIVAALAARAGGSEMLEDMGGIAFRAPILATLFLIVSLATLAIPGSSNFAGEFLILLGLFKAKLAMAMIASLGVVGAAAYALRLYIHVDAQPGRPERCSRARSAAVTRWRSCPIVAVILVLAFYPQFGLSRSERAVRADIDPGPDGTAPGRPAVRLACVRPPDREHPRHEHSSSHPRRGQLHRPPHRLAVVLAAARARRRRARGDGHRPAAGRRSCARGSCRC